MGIKQTVNQAYSNWMRLEGNEADVVISSRIRLARNVEGLPFPHKLTKEQAKTLLAGVDLAIKDKELKRQGSFEFVRYDELTDEERQTLVEKHLVSPQHIKNLLHGGIIISDAEDQVVMINEEDHLRIQTIYAGLSLQQAYATANKLDDVLEQTLDFAYCEKRGYLTSCLTNVGTGLRASIMVHLPGLVMLQQIGKVIQGIGQLGMTVRGLYGEGTEASGFFFQISNQITLGRSEEDIVSNLLAVAEEIIHKERSAREYLLHNNEVWLKDKLYRTYGILKHAYKIDSQETLSLLSDLRLGITLGLIKGIRLEQVNELLVATRPVLLQRSAKEKLSAEQRDLKRAQIVRALLSDQ